MDHIHLIVKEGEAAEGYVLLIFLYLFCNPFEAGEEDELDAAGCVREGHNQAGFSLDWTAVRETYKFLFCDDSTQLNVGGGVDFLGV